MHIYSNWHNETPVSVMAFGHNCFTNKKYTALILGLVGIYLFGNIWIRIFLHPFGLDDVPGYQTQTSSQEVQFWFSYVRGVSSSNTTALRTVWRKYNRVDALLDKA